MQPIDCDVAIIGAGIVGACTAWQLQHRYPHKRILLLDKEADIARHQTGRNSGVIHAGVYYQPGSLKARFCKRGAARLLDFCREHRLPFEQPGKLLVATDPDEVLWMQALYQRCLENEIQCSLLDGKQLRAMEPHINGLGAVHVPATGITDFRAVCRCMTELFREAGGTIRLQTEVTAIEENAGGITLHAPGAVIRAGCLVCCAGLNSDRMARAHGLRTEFRIIPFRGEYYRLPPSRKGLIRRLIYPIPDPALPFLGVHLTPMIDGGITVGPNAVLGWKREGYGRFNVRPADVLEIIGFAGFWKVMSRYFRYGVSELRNSLWKRSYVQQVRKYCPELTPDDLQPHGAGIRAQAVTADGSLVSDFLFLESPRGLHVCNAPSPAATSAIPIAEHICDRITEKLDI